MGDAFGLCGQPFAGAPRERPLQSDTWRRTLRYRSLSLLEYIRRHIAERLAEVARVMGAPESVISVEELSKMAIVLLRRLQKNVGLDITLGELGFESSKLSTLAEDTMRTMGGLVTVTPGNLKTVDLRNIYEMSM